MKGDVAVENLRFTDEHEWINIQERKAVVGISDYAQNEMGDVVFAELPEVGRQVKKGDILATLESVKAVSDVYAPLNGRVVKVNGDLESAPQYLNEDPYGRGWIAVIEIEEGQDLRGFMTSEEYASFIKGGE